MSATKERSNRPVKQIRSASDCRDEPRDTIASTEAPAPPRWEVEDMPPVFAGRMDFPFSTEADAGYQTSSRPRSFTLQSLTDDQFYGLQVLFNGLWNSREKLQNGEPVDSRVAAIKWALEEIARQARQRANA